MASMSEIDQILDSRLSGTPPATLRTLAGTLYRRQAGGTINYIGTIGNMGQIGTVLLTVHVGTLHKVDRIGTLDEVTTIGSLHSVINGRLGSIGRVGTVNYVPRIGSIGHLGSQPHVGSVNRIGGGRIGSIGRLDGAGTINIDQRGRRYDAAGARGTTSRLGCGSTHEGSWQHVGSYQTKTFMAKFDGTAAAGRGSIIIIGGMAGTGENDGTFTYYKGGVGKGSADTASFTETMRYAKAKVRQHGGPAGSWQTESGGTVQARWGLQV